MKQRIIIEQAFLGAYQYRIRREKGDDLVSPQNYGSWNSALDAAIEKINSTMARAKRRRKQKWQ